MRNYPSSFLRQIDIHELLPQQEPFVMVDALVGFDDACTVTETTIREDNIFVDQQRFTTSGLIENIAQTCAARIGFVNKYILRQGIRIGFIGAIRNLDVSGWPRVGDVITTTVRVCEEVFGMTLAEAVVKCGERTLVTTEIKIAVKS